MVIWIGTPGRPVRINITIMQHTMTLSEGEKCEHGSEELKDKEAEARQATGRWAQRGNGGTRIRERRVPRMSLCCRRDIHLGPRDPMQQLLPMRTGGCTIDGRTVCITGHWPDGGNQGDVDQFGIGTSKLLNSHRGDSVEVRGHGCCWFTSIVLRLQQENLAPTGCSTFLRLAPRAVSPQWIFICVRLIVLYRFFPDWIVITAAARTPCAVLGFLFVITAVIVRGVRGQDWIDPVVAGEIFTHKTKYSSPCDSLPAKQPPQPT